jgi:DNA-binding transcriptional regulator YiaG
MATTWTYERCGHTHRDGTTGPAREASVDSLCRECRAARVGETITFLRFGSIPGSGVSTNHRDRTAEEGVSVYEIVRGKVDLVGWYFDFLSRPAFRGRGVIVGWGSDGEPLVRVLTSYQIGRKQAEELVANPYEHVRPSTPGDLIRAARRHAGLTVRALAARVGVGQSWISDLERGHAPVPAELALKLARALDLGPQDLRPDLPW